MRATEKTLARRRAAVLWGVLTISAAAAVIPAGCETAPPAERREDVALRAETTTAWFKSRVTGLSAQIDRSAGYIVFPDVAQWGIVFGGGTRGRGVLYSPDGTAQGWAAVSSGSVGLQAGVQGFRMLIVIENQTELTEFKTGKWNGTANAVAVAGEGGSSGVVPFVDGVAAYQGANSGLMAGVSFGLSNVAYEPMARR